MIQTDTLKAAGVSEQEIRQLTTAWEAFQTAKKPIRHQMPHIVCTGIYNAGKSTLLNALAGKEIFPTGNIPTTKKIAQAKFSGAVYIDTPGLNAAEEDDREAQAAYETADFILFVANAQNGGISAAEAAWLQKLKERYGSLQQRLIFVLTHSAQVDPEQLSAVREKVCGDLMKTVEFKPEQVLCVDSVTYQEGKGQKESLLMESSGIPQLRDYLVERIAGAEEALQHARENELALRRRDVTQSISKISETLQSDTTKAVNRGKEQAAAVDKMWIEFETALGKVMPPSSIEPISHHFICLVKSQGGDANSLMECARRVKDALGPIYDSMPDIANEAADRAEKSALPYCTCGMDSAYFACCNKINQTFEKFVLDSQKLGIPISKIPEIEIKPHLSSNFSDKVMGYLHRDYKEYVLSLSTYVDKYVWLHELGGGPFEYKDIIEKRGFFGGTKYEEVTRYMYDIYAPSNYMQENLQRAIDSNINMANHCIDLYWKDFAHDVKAAVEAQKAALKKQIDTYQSAQAEKFGSTDTQTALNYLHALQKEVTQ